MVPNLRHFSKNTKDQHSNNVRNAAHAKNNVVSVVSHVWWQQIIQSFLSFISSHAI